MVESLARSMCDSEPLGQLLIRRLRINTRARALVLTVAVGVLLRFVIPWINGLLFARPGIWSSLDDWAGMFTSFVGIPATWSYFCFDQPDMTRNLFKGFASSGVLEVDAAGLDLFLIRLRRRLAWRAWFLALPFVTLSLVLHAREVLTRSLLSYYCPNLPIFFGLYFLWTGIAIYMIWIMLVRHLTVVAGLFMLFRAYKTQVYALHPDRCGGLAFMGEFSLRASYFIAILAMEVTTVFLVSLELQQNPSAQLHAVAMFLAYLILAPAAFFLPLAPAHRGMLLAKRSAQALISDGASTLFARIQEGLRDGVMMPSLMFRLEKMRRLHELTDSFPVWPLDLGTVRRFLTANAIPLLTLFMEALRRYLQSTAR